MNWTDIPEIRALIDGQAQLRAENAALESLLIGETHRRRLYQSALADLQGRTVAFIPLDLVLP